MGWNFGQPIWLLSCHREDTSKETNEKTCVSTAMIFKKKILFSSPLWIASFTKIEKMIKMIWNFEQTLSTLHLLLKTKNPQFWMIPTMLHISKVSCQVFGFLQTILQIYIFTKPYCQILLFNTKILQLHLFSF